jgi:hypothetical protein
MTKIFQYLGYIIRFYTNDHLPIHVHVEYQGKEVKVEFVIQSELVILLFKKVRGKNPLTETEAKEVSVFLKSFHKKIVQKWEQVFIYHQPVKCEVLLKRLKRK